MTDSSSINNYSSSEESESERILSENYGETSSLDDVPSESEENFYCSDEEILSSGKRKLSNTAEKPPAKRRIRARKRYSSELNVTEGSSSGSDASEKSMKKFVSKFKSIAINLKNLIFNLNFE